MNRIRLAAAIVCAMGASAAGAVPFVWSSAGDILTFDIHAQNESLNSTAVNEVYEGLVRRNPKLEIEPCLATSWKRVPEGFLFEIRRGVKFHEGETLTADDVVFSINRALSPKSQFRSSATGILGAEKKGDYEVLLKTVNGSPVIIAELTTLMIMNKSWAEKHGALEPQDFIGHQEAYQARHANGTGPFKLKSRQEDVKTVFVANEDWWDQKNRVGNVTELTYMPIKSAATRTAALLSGQVQFVLDAATQDLARLKKSPGIKVEQGPETRMMMIAFDEYRDASPYVRDAQGNPMKVNPFKDKRVRQALSLAVNRDGMVRGVMRGAAVASGTIVPKGVTGWTAVNAEPPKYDLARAKALLAEAGYPQGFGFTLDCPNNRWLNDENICKALAGMWAKAGVKVDVNAMPRAQYFPKILSFDISAALVGWAGGATFDGLFYLKPLSATYDKKTGMGISNIGRASDKEIDRIVEEVTREEDSAKRTKLLEEGMAIEKENVYHVPLQQQTIPWAMRSNVQAVFRPDNRLTAEWVVVK
jgi:peptide/nickel transport system substrate-binding protein